MGRLPTIPAPSDLRRRARAWRNIATSATMARVDPDWIPRPHAGHLITTFKCNLKCAGCGSWKVKDHDDLTTEEWRMVLRQLTSLDIVKVLGGEPFVRKDIVDILRGVREIVDPYILQLTTNGMLTERVVEAVHAVAWPGLQLRISVDGTPLTHDRMRGVEGSSKKVYRTVAEVAELKARYGFKFGINFAVTDDSVGELDAMLAFAEEHGADLFHGVKVVPFLVGTIPPEIQRPRVIDLRQQKALQALRDRHNQARTPLVDHVLSRFVEGTFERQLEGDVHAFPCRELKDLLYMLPNGDVVRCGLDHEPIGNLRETRFDDLWFGDRMKAYRQKVANCPGCLQASVQILSRVYGGCPLA